MTTENVHCGGSSIRCSLKTADLPGMPLNLKSIQKARITSTALIMRLDGAAKNIVITYQMFMKNYLHYYNSVDFKEILV